MNSSSKSLSCIQPLITPLTLVIFLFISACQNSNKEQSDQHSTSEQLIDGDSLLLEDSTGGLRESLITGRDSSDSAAYWNCSSSVDSNATSNIFLRIWSNQLGYSGRQAMTWSIDESNNLVVDLEQNTVVMQNLVFTTTNNAEDQFTALGNGREEIICSWQGPPRRQQVIPVDDGQNELPPPIVNNANEIWRCNNITGLQLEGFSIVFSVNGVGTLNSNGMNWDITPSQELVVSNDAESLVLTNVVFTDDTSAPNGFTTVARGGDFGCERASN